MVEFKLLLTHDFINTKAPTRQLQLKLLRHPLPPHNFNCFSACPRLLFKWHSHYSIFSFSIYFQTKDESCEKDGMVESSGEENLHLMLDTDTAMDTDDVKANN